MMGEAEDVVLGRTAVENFAQRRALERRREQCVAEIKALIPKLREVLKSRNYDLAGVIGFHTVLQVRDGQRVGWRVYATGWENDSLFALADGDFAFRPLVGETVILKADQLDRSWAPYALELVKRIAELPRA